MGAAVSCLTTGVAWCCCTALASLLTSCCGNDKDSTVPPGASSGRKRSIFLLLLSIGFSFLYQYSVGPRAIRYNNDFGPIGWVGNAFWVGCNNYQSGNGDDASDNWEVQEVCAGQTGVYRAAGSAFLFFILSAITAYCKPTFNREAWVAKYTLFIFLVVGTLFIPNAPVFLPIFVNIFRVGAVLYIIFNQLIILDICFNVNESWVEKADQADIDEGLGAGRKWLGALLALCALLYVVCFVAIGLMYAYFGGCRSNIAFITITLVMGIVSTFVQLTGEEASLFTSASIFTYATYLLYTSVSKNPNQQCNPQFGDDDVAGIILGVGMTLIGVLWTGFSQTAYKTVGDKSDALEEEKEKDGDNADEEGKKNNGNTAGLAIGDGSAAEGYGTMEGGETTGEESATTFSNSWKMNVILAAICCWFAMVLTSWGAVASEGTVANPSVGKASMWMIIASQWLMNLLYMWTLVAPKIFPDRDFS